MKTFRNLIALVTVIFMLFCAATAFAYEVSVKNLTSVMVMVGLKYYNKPDFVQKAVIQPAMTFVFKKRSKDCPFIITGAAVEELPVEIPESCVRLSTPNDWLDSRCGCPDTDVRFEVHRMQDASGRSEYHFVPVPIAVLR